MANEWDGLLEGLRDQMANTFAYALDQHEITGIDAFLLADRALPVLRAKLLPLLEAGQAMRDEGQRLVDWLGKLAVRADENAKDRRFISLAEANAADAKNYRATAKAMCGAIRLMDAARDAARKAALKGGPTSRET